MTRIVLFLCAIFVALASALPAAAHMTELAVLRITETSEGIYKVAWELKPNTDRGEGLEPVFPPHCIYAEPNLDCGTKRLSGPLGFEGIGTDQSAAMFKIRDLGGNTQVHTVTPVQPFVDVAPSFNPDGWSGKLSIASSYLAIGVDHILKGVDHLLFVLGLIWIARGSWMLLKTITAFTLAHTVTLVAVTFGWVGVPEAFVNTMIALSIVFIGVEVLKAHEGQQTLTLRFPWAVSIFFGLLHGFGFANALTALGLPEQSVPLALLSFNLGVELGQIAFVLVILALAWSYRVMRIRWPVGIQAVPAYGIGGIAAFWFFDRAANLLGV